MVSNADDMISQVLAQAEDPAYKRARTVRILLRQDLLARHADLDDRLKETIVEDGKYNREAEAPLLAAELEALEAEIEAAGVPFRFVAVGHRRWSDVLAKYPPSPEQLKASPSLDFNPDTFPVAAIAESCAEPAMTLTEAKRLESALNEAQFGALWGACLDVNMQGLDPPNSLVAGVVRRMNVKYATTPVPAASRAQSSLAE